MPPEHLAPHLVEGGRIAGGVRQAQHLADQVCRRSAVELAVAFHDHVHARLVLSRAPRRQGGDVDRRHDAPPQVQRAGHLCWRQRHAGDALRPSSTSCTAMTGCRS